MRAWAPILGAVVLAAGAAGPGAAAPLLDAARTLSDGTVVIPDTGDPALFYFVPSGLRLGARNGRPELVFYKSVGVSGADGSLTGGGVLALTLERSLPGGGRLAAWREELGGSADLRPLPASRVVCRLFLTSPEEEGAGADPLGERRAPWGRKSLSIALSAPTASLLWEALERPGNLALVADVEVVSPGYVETEGGDGAADLAPDERVDRFSVPVPVSRKEHPELFSLVHLAEELSFEYRRLTVFCFDFAEGGSPHLARILVEVRLETPRGQEERHTLLFSRHADPMQEIELRVPVRPEQPYRYRVTRVATSGARAVKPWKEGHHAHLDVSRSEIETQDGAPAAR